MASHCNYANRAACDDRPDRSRRSRPHHLAPRGVVQSPFGSRRRPPHNAERPLSLVASRTSTSPLAIRHSERPAGSDQSTSHVHPSGPRPLCTLLSRPYRRFGLVAPLADWSVRSLLRGRGAALVGPSTSDGSRRSMLFSFKTILAVYAGWLPVVTAISALPLLFGTAARALERPDVRSSLMLGGASALALHAGHLQLTYYAALFSAAWATLSIAGRVSKGEHATGWRIARTLALATVDRDRLVGTRAAAATVTSASARVPRPRMNSFCGIRLRTASIS